MTAEAPVLNISPPFGYVTLTNAACDIVKAALLESFMVLFSLLVILTRHCDEFIPCGMVQLKERLDAGILSAIIFQFCPLSFENSITTLFTPLEFHATK